MASHERPRPIYGRATRAAAVEAYYAYLDSRDDALSGVLEGPGGGPLPGDVPQGDKPSRRLRLSVIGRDDFERIAPRFEDIPALGASPGQRARRLAALIEHLDPVPLEIMDIHIPFRGRSGRLMTRPAIGGWCRVEVGETVRMEGRLPVLIGDPDGEEEDRLRALISVLPVSEAELAALRRVFSLAHIADLDAEEGLDGTPDPRPHPPIPPADGERPRPRRSQRLQVIRVPAQRGDITAEIATEGARVTKFDPWATQASEEDPPQQHIQLTRD